MKPKQHTLFDEWRKLAALCIPVLIAQFCQTAVGVIDTIMAGQYGADDLAAIALGYSFWLPASIGIIGLVMAGTPLIAHAVGAGNSHESGHWLLQSHWLALLSGFILAALLWHSPALLPFFKTPDKLIPLTDTYIKAIAWGMPGIALYQAWRSFNEGQSNTRIIMVIGIFAMLLNIPLNYIFIYGKLGAPEMGGAGCGVASAIVMWVTAISLAAYTLLFNNNYLKGIEVQDFLPDTAALKTLFILGFPIAIALVVEMAAFTGIALLLAYAGETVIAAHQITLNFTALIFMIPLSISMAMTIRIGQALGANQIEVAIFIRRSGQKLTLLVALFSAAFIFLFAEIIAGFYTNNEAIKTMAAALMTIACIYQIPDALQISANGSLRGWKDTKVPMFMVMASYWIVGLPLGYVLSTYDWRGEPLYAFGYWWGLVAGLSVACVLLNGRLFHLEKRGLQTIQ